MKAIAILLQVIVLLFAASAALASPQDGQSWSEQPWTGAANSSPQALRETTLSDPITFNLSGKEPRFIRIGETQYNYSEYVSAPGRLAPALPELWIRDGEAWSRHEEVTAGEDVELIAHAPKDGNADLYLISYANSTIAHWNFKSLADYYYRLSLIPEETGRLFLLMAQGNEPGNALILDVLPRQTDSLSASTLNVDDIRIGEALITVKSERFSGYDVYVDGVFFSSDSADGSLDGVASFTVGGEKVHTITIYQRDIQGAIINKSEHTKSFKRDTAYTLWIA